MTSPSVLVRPPDDLEKILSQQMTDFINGVKRGIIARSQGRVQPLDEVIAELGIN